MDKNRAVCNLQRFCRVQSPCLSILPFPVFCPESVRILGKAPGIITPREGTTGERLHPGSPVSRALQLLSEANTWEQRKTHQFLMYFYVYIRNGLLRYLCLLFPSLIFFKTQWFKRNCSIFGELRDSIPFAKHAQTSHSISKHRPPSVYPLNVTLDVTTNNAEPRSCECHGTGELGWLRAPRACPGTLGKPRAALPRCQRGDGGQPCPGHRTGRGSCWENSQPPGWRNRCRRRSAERGQRS